MIIGNGLLATTFDQYKLDEKILIFASGVSDSSNRNKKIFLREKNLLIKTIIENSDKIIVYFSSCDVIYAEKINTAYYYHKLAMESIVKKYSKKHYILRLPQLIAYSNNRNTLLNHFIFSVVKHQDLIVWTNAYKNLVSIGDVLKISELIIYNDKFLNKTINVINSNYYPIDEIIKTIEKILDTKTNKEYLNIGFKPNYEVHIDYLFDENYLYNSLFNVINTMRAKGTV